MMVMLEMVTGYSLPMNCTFSMPSKPQRMKDTWEIQEATGGVGGGETGQRQLNGPHLNHTCSVLLTEPHVLNVDDKASGQVEDGEQGVAHEG